MTLNITSKLHDWDSISSKHDWKSILIGNGASIAIWSKFTYGSIFKEAGLSSNDKKIFEALETRDFEQVLRTIHLSSIICEQLGHSNGALERYTSIKNALAAGVHKVHVPWKNIPRENLEKIASALRAYRHVFSTNYDLILYWSVMSVDALGFKDYFWSNGTYFDIDNTDVQSSTHTLLHFLHGALHLAQGPNSPPYKRRVSSASSQNLLDSFADPNNETPLFVSEGSSEQKLKAIRASDYLRYCYNKLKSKKTPLVIFGSSLEKQDEHIAKSISRHQERPIAISIYPISKQETIKRKLHYRSLSLSSKIYFFDSRTHPLGDASLSAT